MTASKEKRKDPRELLDLDIREVSLVDRPAIRRKFLVIKRDEDGENMSSERALASDAQDAFIFDEVICKDEEKTETKAEDETEESDSDKEEEEEEETKAEEKTEDDDDKDDSDKEEEEEKSVSEDADKLKEEKAEDSDKEKEEEEAKEEEEEEKKADSEVTKSVAPFVAFAKRDDGSYDLSGVPKNMQAAVEQICKQHEDAVQKTSKLEEILKAERGERLRRDFIEKADKEYTNLPGSSEDLGVLIKSLHDLDEAVAQKIEGIFKTVNAQLESGAILEEVGTPAVEAETTAWGRIEKQASELVSTGDSNSQAAAISKVLEMNPQLYQDYLKEGGN